MPLFSGKSEKSNSRDSEAAMKIIFPRLRFNELFSSCPHLTFAVPLITRMMLPLSNAGKVYDFTVAGI